MIDAGEPAILLGSDTGANPVEYLLHALAACLTTTIVYVAAARKVELTSVESTLTGDMDVRGALGVDDEPRNGFERIGVSFRVTGNAPEEKLREVVERAQTALGRLRHGHQRRARRRRGDDPLGLACGPWPEPRSGHGSDDERIGEFAMPIELTAHTEAGARLVAIAEELSPQLASRAAEHDRDGSYPFEAIDALKAADYFAAPVPVGSVGSASPRRTTWSSRRAAWRAATPRWRSASTCTSSQCSTWSAAAKSPSRPGQSAAPAPSPRRWSRSLATVSCSPPRSASAGRTSLGRARLPPAPSPAGGSTGARCSARCRPPPPTSTWPSPMPTSEGTERYAYAMVPTDAPGVVVHDDWDALGMRASGSNSISLEGVELPESGVRGGFKAGDPLPYMERNLVAGLFHAAASLGIAESAEQVARRGIVGRINGDARPRMQVAENTIELAASRASSRARRR